MFRIDASSKSHKSSMNVKQLTPNYILDNFPKVVKWLEERGVRIANSRYSHYMEYIGNVTLTPKKQWEIIDPEKVFQDANLSLVEVLEIILIYEAFKGIESLGLNQRLKRIVEGKDFYKENSSDPGRDYLFELNVARFFSNKGYMIDFDSITDVVAKRGNDTLYIECKRLKGNKRLESNFRKACKQLSNADGHRTENLVFIDITNCYANEIPAYEYDNEIMMQATLKMAYDRIFRKSNAKKITEILNEYQHVTGVVFMTYKGMWRSDVAFRLNEDAQMIVPENMSDEKLEFLKYLLSEND